MEIIDPKRPARLWLLIQKYMEQEQSLDDFFEDKEPAVRIHESVENSCVAFEG